jgi:hypothetical protein
MVKRTRRQRYIDSVRRMRYLDRKQTYKDALRVHQMYMDGVAEKYAEARKSLAINLKSLKEAAKDFIKKVLIFLKIKKPEQSSQALQLVKQTAKILAGSVKSVIGSVMAFSAIAAVAGAVNSYRSVSKKNNITIPEKRKALPPGSENDPRKLGKSPLPLSGGGNNLKALPGHKMPIESLKEKFRFNQEKRNKMPIESLKEKFRFNQEKRKALPSGSKNDPRM